MSYTIQIEREEKVIHKVLKNVTLEEYIGHRVKEERLKKYITSKDVVRDMGEAISATHLRRIEEGTAATRVRDLEAISKTLGIEVRDLFPPAKVKNVLEADHTL